MVVPSSPERAGDVVRPGGLLTLDSAEVPEETPQKKR